MASTITISCEKLSRLVGTPKAPLVVDVRTEDDFAADPRLVPGAVLRDHATVASWAAELAGRPVVIVCQAGAKLSHGVAAWLRHEGVAAEVVEGWPRGLGLGRPAGGAGSFAAATGRPGPDHLGYQGAAEGRPNRLSLADPALRRSLRGVPVRPSVRGRGGRRALRGCALRRRERLLEPPRRALHLRHDGRGNGSRDADLAPEAPGLLAASLGLSRMYAEDLEQLEAGLLLYDAFYRWCRDATDETHNWPARKGGS